MLGDGRRRRRRRRNKANGFGIEHLLIRTEKYPSEQRWKL
jgi:hypothetical protein